MSYDTVPCTECWLRPRAYFRQFSKSELEFIRLMKNAHVTFEPRADVIEAGQVGGALYTVYEGWGIRYRKLTNDSRQILDVLLPGDLIGMESHVLGFTEHSVQAVTMVRLCVLRGRRLDELFQQHSEWGLSLLRCIVEDQRRNDSWRTILGRLDAQQRIAFLFLEIFDRLKLREMTSDNSCPFPLARQHLGDALGLSRVHVSRVLSDFAARDLAQIDHNILFIRNRAKLVDIAGYHIIGSAPRVLL
jgi:CRP/FNR family transcriptional regulator, anaerobic regulatory protein